MGKISKPQKSSKHKKIKAVDPFYKGNRVADRSAVDANQAPPADDDTYLPHSMKELLHRKGKMHKEQLKREKMKKEGKKMTPKNKFKAERLERGMSRPLKPAPEFKQGKKESNKQFLNRIERETQAVINRSKFEDKYGVEVVQKANGSMEIIDPTKEAKKAKRKERLQKKKEKKEAAKLDKFHEKKKDFSELKDKVEFGEVAMEPPTITAKPRNAPPRAQNHASTLLLARKVGAVARKVGEVHKKKNMSLATRERLDDAREEAIALYRQHKRQQQQQQQHGV